MTSKAAARLLRFSLLLMFLVVVTGHTWTFSQDLEAGIEGKAVGCAAGETGQDGLMTQMPDLARSLLHDGVVKRHLAVGGHGHLVVDTHAENGRRMNNGQHMSS